jgi:enoyl-CoA hydratase
MSTTATSTAQQAGADAEVLHELRPGGVLRVTVNRPRKRNALSRAVLNTLRETFDSYRDEPALKVAVLTGAGEKCFAAGGDLRDLDSVRTLGAAEDMARHNKAALNAIRWFPLPVVGALNGDAIGGGSELAMACDLRVAARHARFGFIQPKLNITTAWGGAADLISRVGSGRALDLLCRAELYSAAEARALDLVDAVAAEGQSLEAALEAFIAPYLRQVPQVLRTYKALITAWRRGEVRAEIDELETRRLAENWVHEDHWAAAAHILDKRGDT